MLHGSSYLPHQQSTSNPFSNLVLAIGLMERISGRQARLLWTVLSSSLVAVMLRGP